ncbi:MAG TPA: glycosyltransferase [Longimicrobiales bacterium]|nr:glycosyltransferase [Longimicrobiales bacterium]
MSHGEAAGRHPEPPFVSVIVPTFRRPDRVKECVAALRQQDYPADRLEVLIVDDGSPDPVEIDGSVGSDGPGIRLIRQRNAGPARARNHGAAEAEGSVLAFTDDDCRPDPGWAAALVRALAEEPLALTGGTTVNGLERNLMAEASQVLIDYLYEYFERARRLLPFFTSNNIAVSAEAFRAMGGFDESFRFSAGEDRDLSERWAREIGPLRHVPEATVRHFHHLSLGSFLRQHHYYGRGATHLARRRRVRGAPPPTVEPMSFYTGMLMYPLRNRSPVRGVVLSGLMLASQAATVTGVLVESVRPSSAASGPGAGDRDRAGAPRAP